MRKLATALLAAGALGLAAAPAALTAPADQSPVGNENSTTAHPHHIHTGNGECVDIDSVKFEHDTRRGLHRGGNASGPDKGPWHGTCANHRHPPA